MSLGLVVTSFALGLRLGVDCDYIAAIVDLTGMTSDRRSPLYAPGLDVLPALS